VGAIFIADIKFDVHFSNMTIASAFSAAATYQSASNKAAQSAQAMREAAIERAAQERQAQSRAVKAESVAAVRQSPRAEGSVMQTSRDLRQLVGRSMRNETDGIRAENRRRSEEQQVAYAREMARRSEYIRREGNTVRESFQAIA
jgi:hypothetical protein